MRLSRLHVAQKRGAEIRDLDLGSPRHQDIGGLDVPVHHALTIGIVEGATALESNFDHVRHRQQALRRGVAREIASVHILHHDIADLVVDHGVENRDDVRMNQLAGERRLAQELAS